MGYEKERQAYLEVISKVLEIWWQRGQLWLFSQQLWQPVEKKQS